MTRITRVLCVSILAYCMLNIPAVFGQLSGVNTINPSGTNFTGNPGGTSGKNYTSFTNAVNALTAYGVSSQVIFNVYADTFVEQIKIPVITGASATNTITFQSQNLDSTSVVITYAARSADTNYVIYLNGADYFTFRKMSIIASGYTFAYAVVINNKADHNTFIDDIVLATPGFNTNYGCFFSYDFNLSTLDQYNTIKDNLIIGGYRGIYFFGNNTNSLEAGNIIEGNTIKGFYSEGIKVYYQNVLRIVRNTIIGWDQTPSSGGIIVSSCDNGGEISYNNIKLNSPLNSYMYGISLNNARGTSSVHGKVFNNVISITGPPSTWIRGIGLFGNNMSLYLDVSFNSVNIYPTTIWPSNLYTYCIDLDDNNTCYVYLKNNIFANFMGGYIIRIGSPGDLSVSDYNAFYTTGSYFGLCSGNCNTFGNWRTITNKDFNSVYLNPLFFSNTDLHVNTSGLSNKGTSITGITTDMDGDTRSTTIPDIGADEFTLITNDAGINDIAAPLPPDSGLNQVFVKIKNYGTTNLSNVVVNWQVNGALQTPDSVTALTLTQAQEIVVNIGSYNFIPGIKYHLKFWTTYPNGVNDGNFRNDTFNYYNLQTGISGTYTIGGSTGFYPSFNAAVSDLIAKGLVGAVKYRVYPGSYNERVSIPSILGSSDTNTITFESYNYDSNSVDLNYAAESEVDNYVFQLNGADYVTVRQIKIRATGSSFGYAVVFRNYSDYIKITNNIISSPIGSSYNNFQGIAFKGFYNYNCIISNNIIQGGSYGVYISGSNNILDKFNIVQNNIIKNFWYCGIYCQFQKSIVVNGNYIEGNTYSNSSYGILISACFDSNRITKNKIIVNTIGTNYGINIEYSNGSATTAGLVANNFIVQTGSSVNNNYGIYITTCNYLNIYFNSVRITSSSAMNGMAFYQTKGSELRIANNIFANSGSGYSININTPSAITSMNYNNLVTKGTILGKWDTSSSSNLAMWKSKSNRDINSISIDPLYYSSTDLHSSATGLIGKGINIPNLTDDFDGDTRNISSPCIGADEIRLVNRDGSITTLVSPVIPCQGTSSYVIVNLKNFGLDTLKSTKIKWKVNGVNQTPVLLSCNLYLSEDTNVIIGTYTFNANTTYSIKVWIDSINSYPDQNHKNDTLFCNDIKTGMGGTYTIGAVGKNYTSFTSAVNDLINFGICSPVIFEIDSGIYNEQINIHPIRNSSSVNTITFRSSSNKNTNVKLRYAGSEFKNYVVKLTGAKYINFNNLTIQNTGKPYGRVIVFDSNAGFDSLSYNKIIGYDTNLASDPNQLLAVVYSNGTSLLNHCQNIVFNYNKIQYGTYGIWFNGYYNSLNTFNNCFDHDTISNFSYNGAYLQYLSTTIFTNNTISSNSTNCVYGIQLDNIYYSSRINNNSITINGTATSSYGIRMSNSSYSNQISNNFISNLGSSEKGGIYLQECTMGTQVIGNRIDINSSNQNQYGIYSYNFNYPDGATKSVLLNNIISLKGSSSSTSYGIFYYTSYGSTLKNIVANNFISQTNGTGTVYGFYSNNSGITNVLYNSINITAGNTSSYGLYFESYSNNANYKNNYIMNNISVVTGGGYPIGIFNTSSTVKICDYNDLYKGTGNYIGRWNNSTDCATVSNWQSTSKMDSNSKSIDAPFKSTHDLHLGYSNFLGVSNVLPDITTDIDGDTRSTTNPIIGADEKPSIENDAGISEIISPTISGCEGAYPVKVKVINFSIINLNSVDIDWSINGVSKPTIHLKTSLSYLKDTVINIGMDTFSGGDYKIKIQTNLPNGITDQDQSNDADSVNFKIYSLPDVKFLVNDSTECLRGNIFSFTNKTNIDTGLTANYLWKFGDGKTSTVTNPTYSYNAIGNYFTKLIVMLSNGCKDSSNLKSIQVYNSSKAGFVINDSTQCLRGNYFKFTDNSSIQNGVVYSKKWNLGDGTIKKDSNTGYVYKTSGIYNIKLVINSSTSGCSDSISRQIFVFPDPSVYLGMDTIVKNKVKLTLNTGLGFDSCRWSTGAKSSQITVDSSGVGIGIKEIWVRVYKNGCMGTDTIKITFTPNVNLQNEISKLNIRIYPNPANSYIIVKIEDPEPDQLSISIVDMYGKTLKQISGEKAINSSYYFDLKEQPTGIYFIRIDTEKGSVAYKINVVK